MVEISEIGVFDDLSCGMPLSEAIVFLGNSFDTFKRQPEDKATIYAYDDKLIHLTVNEDEIVEVISVFQPREVKLRGVFLLGRPVQDVLEELRGEELVINEQEGGYFIPDFQMLLVEVDEITDGFELYG